MKTHSRVIRSLRYRNRIQPVCFQQRAILFCMRTRFCSFRNGSGQYLLTVHMQYPLPAVFIRRPVPDTQSIKFVRHFTHYLVANSITALFMPYRGWSRNTAYAGWLVSDRIYLLPCIRVYETVLQSFRKIEDTFLLFCTIESFVFCFFSFVNRSIDFFILYSVRIFISTLILLFCKSFWDCNSIYWTGYVQMSYTFVI